MILRGKMINFVMVVCFIFSFCGCNRSGLRVPGASLSFPETPTGFRAQGTSFPNQLVVSTPVDIRSQHYGERVGGTTWESCSTDPLWASSASEIIQKRLVTEFQSSGLFSKISTAPTGPNDIIMETEIHAFCSRSVGFIYLRVAGMTSLHVTLKQNGKVLMERNFGKVVTDANPEYTGSQLAMIEQAMCVTMADSLRELLKDMLKQIESDSVNWKVI